MYVGKLVFAQLMDFLPLRTFRRCVLRYPSNYPTKTFSHLDQYLCMAFAELTFRESLRDIEVCLRAHESKLYHLGIRGHVARSNLADANEKRDWQIYRDFANALIVEARRLYAGATIFRFPEMRVLSFQAIAEKDERFRRKGEALFPSLKPLGMLLDQKKLMSGSSWQAEYQQHPYLIGGGIFPIEKLRVIPVFDRREAVQTVLSVDKAGTEDGDGAFTAIVLMHRLKDGRFVIERIVRGHWGALEREKQIKQWATHDRENLKRISSRFTVVIEQEPGSGGKESAEATIRNLAGFTCIADKPGANRSKEAFPAGPHKDQIDAAAQAFHHLTATKGYDISIWR